MALALLGLAIDASWSKFVRVALAAGAYLISLWALAHRTAPRDGGWPYWPFGLAGFLAGAVSGLVRPSFDPWLVLIGTLAAGLLIGGVHWLALRLVRRALGRTS